MINTHTPEYSLKTGYKLDIPGNSLNHRLCIAPMMDLTDRHARYLLRLFSPNIILYTEMVTTGAIIHGDQDRFLTFNKEEHPLALQLGGSNPQDLAHCAKIAEQYNYDEINLNVGCPSDRVQSGRFGACLMAEPELVRDCMTAMKQATNIPLSVKCRIGIDKQESYHELANFIQTVSQSGCSTFIIHARKAWLDGLSPKENREIPPLRYDVVYAIKNQFPDLEIIINGGIKTLSQATEQLKQLDGVMIGREAYHNPYMLAQTDQMIFNETHKPAICRQDIMAAFIPYVEKQLQRGAQLKWIAKHLLGLFQGLPGARAFRRYLSEHMPNKNAGIEVLQQALKLVK